MSFQLKKKRKRNILRIVPIGIVEVPIDNVEVLIGTSQMLIGTLEVPIGTFSIFIQFSFFISFGLYSAFFLVGKCIWMCFRIIFKIKLIPN